MSKQQDYYYGIQQWFSFFNQGFCETLEFCDTKPPVASEKIKKITA